ncbi:hypothetical protein O7606_25325 [Micromonospora sp. WMMD882]|uniref:hypothetical protein n=1 Tax=Micromonospora sp. WMMD882 TaxID=3015151 RepID=UPI00248AB408|nr:hypothetical protein [Micromonospora sp. WMMD882]WBB79438.1 hypothetical protein O7606_25325 [Micromonospora sp. WMMD882]
MTSAAAAGSPVDGVLPTVVIVLSLVLAAWSLVTVARNRPPDRTHLVGLVVLEAALLALAVVALVALGGGERPGEPGAFAGYLVTLVFLPPLAGVLARMEPTRWGAAIVGVVCLVIPVVVVRLQQTWAVVGG